MIEIESSEDEEDTPNWKGLEKVNEKTIEMIEITSESE